MNSKLQTVTKLHLKSFGLTDHLTREIIKGLKSLGKTGGYNLYYSSDVQTSIEAKLSKSRTKEESKEKLRKVRDLLEGKSNVIEVDFLKCLSPEKRIEVLKERLNKLDDREKLLTQETNELLRQAESMIITK